MKKFFVSIFFVFFVCFAEAQVTFQKVSGGSSTDWGFCTQQTSDGGYITVGQTQSSGAGQNDVSLIKFDSVGAIVWSKTYGGPDSEGGVSVQQTTDGGFIIVGNTSGYGAGFIDVLLLKTDSNGNLLWTKTFGESLEESGRSVKQTSDGGYIITGSIQSFIFGGFNTYLIKTDGLGNLQWTKSFGLTNADYGNCVEETIDGGFIIVGTWQSPSLEEVYVIKTDALGNILWTNAYGFIQYDYGEYIEQTLDGGYIITGSTQGFGKFELFLLKIDGLGNYQWAKRIGDNCSANCVRQTSDGGYVFTGYVAEDFASTALNVLLAKTDSLGDLAWSYSYGGSGYTDDEGVSFQKTNDRGYVITGYTKSFGSGLNDMYLIKTDSMGIANCNQNTITMNNISVIPSPPTSTPTPAFVNSEGISTSPTLQAGGGSFSTTICSSGINYPPTTVANISATISNGLFIFSNLLVGDNIEIFNVTGQLVSQSFTSGSIQIVDLTSKSKGVYFYRVFSGTEILLNGKIVLQ